MAPPRALHPPVTPAEQAQGMLSTSSNKAGRWLKYAFVPNVQDSWPFCPFKSV